MPLGLGDPPTGLTGDVPLYRGDAKPGKVPCDAMVWFRLEKR
jgi:hypothetical protein